MRVQALRELFSAEQIANRVGVLAEQISKDYSGKELVMICVLKGAFIFFADLVRRLDLHPTIDFVRVASYGQGESSSGEVRFTKDVEISLEGKDVLLVEDIVDSGTTMHFLAREIRSRGVNSLRIAALVDKYERREREIQVDYIGFSLFSGFIVGYGLDYAEQYRELPGIFTVEPDAQSTSRMK